MNTLLYSSIAPEWAAIWLTPVWILSLGVLLGMLAAAVFGLLVWLLGPLFGAAGRRVRSELHVMLGEGFLLPVTMIFGVFALFAFLGYFIAKSPEDILYSVSRLHAMRNYAKEVEVPPAERDEFGEIILENETRFDIGLASDEIQQFVLAADRRVQASPLPPSVDNRQLFQLTSDSVDGYRRSPQIASPLPEGEWEALYAINYSDSPAILRIEARIAPPVLEVLVVPATAVTVFLIYLIYFLHRVATPRLAAVALATFKSEVNTPLFLMLTSLGVFVIVLGLWIPYNTFGEDIKMLKDSALTLILVVSMIQAIWSASNSVAEEIEGRTALTVLSKPIDRRAFVIGKFVGVFWTVALMFVIMSAVFLISVAYKPIYDSRENSQEMPIWNVCHIEMVSTVPGLLLMLMETMLMTALSVALSTRLPLVPNAVVCMSVYVLGHLTPLLVQTSTEGFEIVRFFAQLLATVIPVLENFNITPAIAAGRPVPLEYLAWSSVYCFLYTVIALLLALLLFEDRDLA